MDDYDISPAGYLERARSRISDATPESLFYAALELRCFVEARQHQYLNAQKKYARSVAKAWETSKQGRQLEKIFDPSRIQHLKYMFDDGTNYDFYYMPVTVALRNGAERLSDLIHAQLDWRDPRDAWWTMKRGEIIRLYRLAWFCSQGNLLSPGMLNKGTTTGDLTALFTNGQGDGIRAKMVPGATFRMEVSYPDMAPTEWKCDL